MLALNILDIKKFMSAFLIGNLFDEFTLREAQITTYITYTIDGRLEKSFFEDTDNTESDEPAPTEYAAWKDVKPHCLDMIKGKRTPLFFRFVFFLPKDQIGDAMAEEGLNVDPATISGLCLNLRFNGQTLVATTGVSLKSFTIDKSVDYAWDQHIRRFLKANEITAEDAI